MEDKDFIVADIRSAGLNMTGLKTDFRFDDVIEALSTENVNDMQDYRDLMEYKYS